MNHRRPTKKAMISSCCTKEPKRGSFSLSGQLMPCSMNMSCQAAFSPGASRTRNATFVPWSSIFPRKYVLAESFSRMRATSFTASIMMSSWNSVSERSRTFCSCAGFRKRIASSVVSTSANTNHPERPGPIAGAFGASRGTRFFSSSLTFPYPLPTTSAPPAATASCPPRPSTKDGTCRGNRGTRPCRLRPSRRTSSSIRG